MVIEHMMTGSIRRVPVVEESAGDVDVITDFNVAEDGGLVRAIDCKTQEGSDLQLGARRRRTFF